MTEQQADALMECIECWEDATKRFPHESSFSDMLAALTALCWHRDFAVYEALLEDCRDGQTIDALYNMQTWETT